MLRLTGQTVGLRLNFVADTHGWPGGVIDYKKFDFSYCFQQFFYGQRRALQLVYIIKQCIRYIYIFISYIYIFCL